MQSSLPSTSKAAFMTDPALAGQSQSDGASTAGGSSETTGVKKTKASGNETSLLERLLRRLQDNRLQSGDPETARKLQEINRSQNASNIILKKILNIAFVTTGVALLLSVIFVIIYTSIVKHSSTKDDDRSSVAMTASNGDLYALLDETNQLTSSSDAVPKGHVRPQQPLSRDTVIVSSDGGGYGEYGYPRVDESSSSSEADRRPNPANPNSRGPGDVSGGTDGGLGVVMRCRAVPMVNEGELKMGQMCYQSKDDDTPLAAET